MRPSEHIRALLHPARSTTHIAVVGASEAPHKYGHVIVQDLARKGFTVAPVNPRVAASSIEARVADLRVYADLLAIPGEVDLAVFVLPPHITLEALGQIAGITEPIVWLQPGAFDPSVLAFASHVFEHVVSGRCIMRETV